MNQQLNIANLIVVKGRLGIFAAMLCLASTVVAGPNVTAHISQEDVQKVCAVIRAATREPILSIDPIYVGKPRANAIARNEFTLAPSKNGKLEKKTITVYELTDEVTVRTGYQQNLQGGGYAVRRVGGTWKIVSRSFWIH
jgi:hypothetical protein